MALRKKVRRKSVSKKAPVRPGALRPLAAPLVLLAGSALLAFLLLQMERFRWMGPSFSMPSLLWGFLFLSGLGLLVLGYRGLPPVPGKGDLPRWAAYPLLAIVFGVAAYLRFYRADQAYLSYWDDSATVVEQAAVGSDFNSFPIIYPQGANEPFFGWFTALLWSAFPGLKALFLQRLSSNLFCLLALWVTYRLGREVSGKRFVGILLAAAMAVSKPALLHNISAQAPLVLMLSTGLFLWFQFRLFRKPDLKHFLQWGAVLGLCLYTYNAIRPWSFVMAAVTFGWLLWRSTSQERQQAFSSKPSKGVASRGQGPLAMILGRAPRWVGPALLIFFAVTYSLFFLDHILFIFHDNLLSRIWAGNLALWGFWQALFALLFIYYYQTRSGSEKRFYAWALGLLFAGFLSHPIALHTEAAVRIGNNSILPQALSGMLSFTFVKVLVAKFLYACQFLFTTSSDRGDMNLVGDPFFDIQGILLILLGVVALVVRPTWTKSFLFLCAPLGIVPFIFTTDSYSAKLLGCLIPLLLLAALAWGEWAQSLASVTGKARWVGLTLVLALPAFFAWEARTTFTRVYDQWWYDVVNDDLAVGQPVDQALKAGKRVFIAPLLNPPPGRRFYSADVQAILHDGSRVYLFHDRNIIHLLPGEDPQDVVVVISGFAKDQLARLKKDFPKASFEPQWQYYQDKKNEVPFLYVVSVPASKIHDASGKCLQFQKVPSGMWARRFYVTGLGTRGGLIDQEDIVPALNPIDRSWANKGVSGEGEWEAPADGDYSFSMDNPNFSQVWLDGKSLLHSVREGQSFPLTETLSLKKGKHRIRYFIYLTFDTRFWDVTIENKAAGYKAVLGAP